MSSHYDCIGIHGEAEIVRVVEAIAAGEGRTRADGGVSIVDRDDSGATVAVHLSSEGELVCATPSFAARPRGRVVRQEGAGLSPGAVVQGQFWLVGRLAEL